ncbi:MAG: hypothetical protein N2690_01865 [Rhodocyclaceae bacterium]|nr:hypothetical protein [Rhodocyclaceae bacterium]
MPQEALAIITTLINAAAVIVAALISAKRISASGKDEADPPASTKPQANDDTATRKNSEVKIAIVCLAIGLCGFLVLSWASLPLTAGTVGMAVLCGALYWTGLWLMLR